MPQWFTVTDCKLVLQSLLSAELSAYRGCPAPDWQYAAEIDSLERLHLAGCVNEFFCLHETGTEDRLLMSQHLDDWVSVVAEAITDTSGLTFRTSGSTGRPCAHLHHWLQIKAEVDALAGCFSSMMPFQRVISWLPLHHLYGFMLGIAFPASLNIPRIQVTNNVLPELQSGDLLVTVPPRWDYLAKSHRSWPQKVYGVCSTGPLSKATSDSLHQQGLTGLLDIYGSTETGGVASRWQTDAPYQLLKHWQRRDQQHVQRRASAEIMPLLDEVLWNNEHSFQLKGRLDDVIAIGGVNVSPAYVAERLCALESVRDCAVRSTTQAAQPRLKAFVVPSNSDDEAAKEIARTIAQWPAAERPIDITYGAALPTNTIGKLTDW